MTVSSNSFPILLDLQQKWCLVVGAGAVGQRKVTHLLAAGARVRWVAPDLPSEAGQRVAEACCRPYRSEDIGGMALVFAATGDTRLNQRICEDARASGIWVSRAEQPEQGDFSLPAVAREGALTLAVSTGGNCPALAALIRDSLQSGELSTWARATEIGTELRQQLLNVEGDASRCRALLEQWLDQKTLDLLRTGEIDKARQRLGTPWTTGDKKGSS